MTQGKAQCELGESLRFCSEEGLKLGDPLNSFSDITNYNNYYEFSEGKEAVAVDVVVRVRAKR